MVFSTKDRLPFLRPAGLRDEMHRMLGGISNTLGCQSIIVGGVEDHVHILGHLSRTISISDWIKEMKRQSSVWAKKRANEFCDFEWQAGYGAFSVSHSKKDAAIHYVATQENHHHTESFQDEYRRILSLHEIDWSEEYVWG